ncbi:MAG: M56 family metallopeptidase [Edaphobacter sp.]|uniref:M56 family metallopeptidase n=1 Tax=Edaphobacter sp. TaxID=1934404 RepID=UPI00239140E4|nr:M56 family metallopeptidase [Edaphobacter sp.]MDE1177243.1 M56 family metallopeptidase [Edaphobacter sp.]
MNSLIPILGWTLIHACWQVIAVVLAYRLLDSLLSRSRSAMRYTIALAAMMGIGLLSVVTFGYEYRRVATESHLQMQRAANGGAEGTAECNSASTLAGANGTPDQEQGTLVRTWQSARRGTEAVFLAVSNDAMPWIDALWFAGVMALSVRMLGGWFHLRSLRRSTRAQAPTAVYAAFVCLAQQMGITKKVDLFVCSRICGPVAMGVLRSIVLLPVSALTQLSPEQLEVVLAHELAHIRRADYLWNMFQSMIETLLFFHPAVWWMGARTRQLRELSCDDSALACCGDPVVYATALLRLEEQRHAQLRLAMAFRGDSGAGLKLRIVRMLEGTAGKQNIQRGEVVPLSMAGLFMLLGAIVLPAPHVLAKGATVIPAAPTALAVPTKPVPPRLPAVAPAIRPVAPLAPLAAVSVAAPAVHLQQNIQTLNSAMSSASAATSAITATTMDGTGGVQDHYAAAMSRLGYTNAESLVAMKINGITPEYAEKMALTGYGKPSANDLIALHIFHVTPEEAEKLRAAGSGPTTIQDLIRYKIFKVNAEYIEAMKAVGLGSLSSEKIVVLRIQNVTADFARSARKQYPDLTVDQLIQMKVFRIDDQFIERARSLGITPLTIDKLVQLRATGMLDDNSVQR